MTFPQRTRTNDSTSQLNMQKTKRKSMNTKLDSETQKVGNPIKDNWCWDSLYSSLKGSGCWVSNFRAASVNRKP